MIERHESAALLRSVGAIIEVEVRGSSMVPTLHAGERVRVRCGRAPSVGQVAGWMAGEHLVSHRVVWVGRNGIFMTQGDAVRLPDPPQPPALVLGVVEDVLRHGTWEPLGAAPTHDGLVHGLGRGIGMVFRLGSGLSLWIPKVLHGALFLAGRALSR